MPADSVPDFGPTVVQSPAKGHNASIILLHGLGDSGDGLAHAVSPSRLHQLHHVRFIYPTAAVQPVTVNGYARMPAWCDVTHQDLMRQPNEDGIAAAVAYLQRLVEAEVAAGVPRNRIVIGGFSQGGHVALKAALQAELPVAAVVGLSTWCQPQPQQVVAPAAQDMPIFIAHGGRDQLVPLQQADETVAGLKQAGFTNVQQHTYGRAGHPCWPAELDDLYAFLQFVVPAVSQPGSRSSSRARLWPCFGRGATLEAESVSGARYQLDLQAISTRMRK